MTRQMFDRSTSRFVTHEDLLTLIDQGVGFSVLSRESQIDLTSRILVRLLMVRAGAKDSGVMLLTEAFLRDLVRIEAGISRQMARAVLDHSRQTWVETGLERLDSG